MYIYSVRRDSFVAFSFRAAEFRFRKESLHSSFQTINIMMVPHTLKPRELCVEETGPLRTVFRASSTATVFYAADAATSAASALWQATLAAPILDARSTGTAAPWRRRRRWRRAAAPIQRHHF